MATTVPDNIRTPDPGDPYNPVSDLATLAGDVQAALILRDPDPQFFTGTSTDRTAFTSTATAGMLWQDTDSIKMIWRKDGAAWVPAVWHWSGTTSQMNAFAAPNGFTWRNTTDNSEYVRISGAWDKDDTGWITPTLLNSYTSDSARPVKYRVSNGRLYITGQANRSSVAAGTTVFNIPNAAHRPTRNKAFLVASSGVNVAKIDVDSNGDIKVAGIPTSPTLTYVMLEVPGVFLS